MAHRPDAAGDKPVQAARSLRFDPIPPGTFGPRVEARVESICQKGCRRVREDIAALRRGEPIPECLGLSPDECMSLLAELEQIMAVYGDTCRID
jgi:hypothetical protein